MAAAAAASTSLGITTLPNGDTYEGSYVEGKRSGRGVYKFVTGAIYDGEWLDNKKHGQGTYFYTDGSRYEGSWCSDQRQEFGKYVSFNGDVYEGSWPNHVRDGNGVYTYGDSGITWTGTWNMGVRIVDNSPLTTAAPDSLTVRACRQILRGFQFVLLVSVLIYTLHLVLLNLQYLIPTTESVASVETEMSPLLEHEEPSSATSAIKLAVMTMFSIGSVLAAPILLNAAGFTTAGIAAGSIAARLMALGKGLTIKNSICALLQSAGTNGIGFFSNTVIGGSAASAGKWVVEYWTNSTTLQ